MVGVFVLFVSLVSCMCIIVGCLFCARSCSSVILFLMPFMFICSMVILFL